MHPEISDFHQELQYCFEINRKATFKKWVFDDNYNCNAAKLAEAGFIFVGTKAEPDAVKCFYCGKSLDSWDEDDDPWFEHLKHSSKCPFARMQKPERSFTLLEFLNIRNGFIVEYWKKHFKEEVNDIDSLLKQIDQTEKNLLRKTRF